MKASQDVLQGVVQCVPKVQCCGHIWWGDDDAVTGIAILRGHGVAEATLLPQGPNFRLEGLGRVGSVKRGFAVRRRHHPIISIPGLLPSVILLAVGLCIASCGDDAPPSGDTAAPSVPAEQVRLDRAERLLSVGRVEDATVLAARLVNEFPSDWRVHDLVARLRLRQSIVLGQQGLQAQARQEAAAATDSYRRALALAPELAGLHQSAGDTASRAGQVQFAQACYEHCLELDPRNVRALLCLSQLIESQDLSEATRLIQQAIAIDETVPEAYAGLAVLQAKQGTGDQAMASIDSAIALDRTSSVVRLAQARVFRITGDPQAGVEVLAALSAEAQLDEAIAWELSACWEALGRHDRVADVWAAFVMNHPKRWDRWVWAVRALEAAQRDGDVAKAAAMARMARRAGAPEEEVVAALKNDPDQESKP